MVDEDPLSDVEFPLVDEVGCFKVFLKNDYLFCSDLVVDGLPCVALGQLAVISDLLLDLLVYSVQKLRFVQLLQQGHQYLFLLVLDQHIVEGPHRVKDLNAPAAVQVTGLE